MMVNFLDSRLPARFWDKAVPVPFAGCWLWTGAASPTGYGSTFAGGRVVSAHRAAYSALVGPIPNGLDLDHLCREPSCVNPAHLEPVTRSVNLKRGETGDPAIGVRNAAEMLARTHCKNGHPFDGDNLKHFRGRRVCIACARRAARECQRRRRAQKGD